MTAPCRNCPDRRVDENYNCHSDCDRYKDFVAERVDLSRYRVKVSENRVKRAQKFYAKVKRPQY